MTKKQLSLKNKIEKARLADIKAGRKYYSLVKKCEPHSFVKSDDSARCQICKTNGGWWCPSKKSPDHLCCYGEEDENGDYDYDYDCCIYCGEPSERK